MKVKSPHVRQVTRDIVLIENEGDDNSKASLKEGVDMRFSERKFI